MASAVVEDSGTVLAEVVIVSVAVDSVAGIVLVEADSTDSGDRRTPRL
jgi:hypothetical protein